MLLGSAMLVRVGCGLAPAFMLSAWDFYYLILLCCVGRLRIAAGTPDGDEGRVTRTESADRSDDNQTMFVDEVWTKCTVTKINSRLRDAFLGRQRKFQVLRRAIL